MATTTATTTATADQQQAVAKNKQMQSVIDGLNVMRQEQRLISNRLINLEADLNEHKLVLDALKQVDENRKAFRLVGGVLIEQTVKDVIPELQTTIEKMMAAAESSEARIKEKGAQIQEYVKEHNLASLLRPGGPVPTPATSNAEEAAASTSPKPASSTSASSTSTGSVLV